MKIFKASEFELLIDLFFWTGLVRTLSVSIVSFTVFVLLSSLLYVVLHTLILWTFISAMEMENVKFESCSSSVLVWDAALCYLSVEINARQSVGQMDRQQLRPHRRLNPSPAAALKPSTSTFLSRWQLGSFSRSCSCLRVESSAEYPAVCLIWGLDPVWGLTPRFFSSRKKHFSEIRRFHCFHLLCSPAHSQSTCSKQLNFPQHSQRWNMVQQKVVTCRSFFLLAQTSVWGLWAPLLFLLPHSYFL